MTKKLHYLCTLLLCMIASVGWGEEVTYTISSKNTLTTEGTAPSGSSASIVETYGTSCQMTASNSQTLTLKGYEGLKITSLVMSMHSNKSGGQAYLSYSLDGGKNFTYIVGSATGGIAFNTTSWNGSWSTAYVNITKDVLIRPITGDLIIKMGATANSIYCKSYTITYETDNTPSLDDNDLSLLTTALTFDLYNDNNAKTINYTTSSTGAVTVSASDYITTSVDEDNKTITVTPTAKTPSAQTITVNQAADANYDEGSATFTVNITDSNPNQPITLWSEDFSSYQANDVPSEGIYNYFCTNGSGNTKVYNENTAGGTSPELLVGKTQGSFSATITDLKNCQGNTATISFITNNTSLAVSIKDQNNNSVEVTGDVLSKQTSTLEFIIPDDATSLTITFTTTNSSNSRLDDIVLLASAISLPRISAENASISYNETSGEIVYTLSKPATDGVLTASTESGWLTLGTVGETVPFTCTTNDAGTARSATVTLTYTYNTNETVTKDVTVTQAANPNFAMTIADVRAQGTGSVVTKGVVTSCVASESNGKTNYTAYIQDATAAICVFGADLTVGDEIRVSGTLSTYNGLLEITNPEVTILSNDNTVAPKTMTIEEVNASTNQGWLVKIVEATVTAISGQNTTIAQGEHTIVVRGITGIEYAVGDILTLTGNIGYFNANQIANPTDVEKKVLTPVTLTFTDVPETITKGKTTICKVTAEPSVEGITYSSSDENIVKVGIETGEITAMGIGTATITANYAGDSGHSSATASYTIQVIGAPYTATFYVNGDKLSEATVNEGSDIEFPVVEEQEINGKKFVGWTTAAIDGTTNVKPEVLVTSATMGESNVAYYAVYANGDVQKENKSIVITSETENVPSSYGTAKTFTEYTLEGIKFKIQQMYKNGEKLQWRAAGNENGTGTMYNTETLALQSVVLAYDTNDSNKNFTLKVGNSENPTDGLEISVSEDKTTFDCSSANASYFVLTNGAGAGYLTSLTINYVEEIGTYSDYCTTVKTYVAQVGDVKYETFAEAVEAANGNDITLLADIEEPYTLTEGQSLTVNHNGHSLTVNPPAGYILDMTELGETTIAYTYTQAVAKIGDKLYASLQDAIEDAEAGATIDVQQDVDATDYYSSDTARMPISKSMTINGNGRTVTVAGRGFGVGMNASDKIDVTFKDITIQNSSAGARCIDTRGNLNSLTLENATLKTDGAQSGYTQPLTIGGNQSDVAKVNITNSNIQTNDEGTAYYAIITFNPVEMNIANSTIKGWANIYAKGKDGSAGSAGSVFTLDGCTLVSSNAYSGVSNSFAAFMTEDNNVTYNIKNSKITINNSGDQIQAIASYQLNNTLTRNSVTLGEGNEVTFVEPGTFAYVNNQNEGNTFVITGGTYNVNPTPYLAEGLAAPLIGGVYTVMPASAIPAAPIIFHDSGEYESELQIAMAGEGTIMYTLNEGEAQTYSAPFTIREDATIKAWAVKDGVASDVTEPKTFTIKEKAKGAVVEDGYYTIKNNGNGKYVNVAGRKTVTFVDETATAAGTVIKVKADADGVKVLRSQGVDVPGYADKAMRYVPEIVKLVVDKLNNLGEGQLMGEAGLEALMNKFNEAFDEHLYLETVGENSYRIYGRTPSMQHVVDFYAENKQYIDPKLPMLEGKINAAIEKVLEKTKGRGASVLVPFSLETVWQNMDGTLTKPVDEASTMKFYEEVLTSETNVWNFAYETAMIYWTKVEQLINDPDPDSDYADMLENLGDYKKYLEKVPNIRPNFKYYIVQKDNKLDIISEGNGELNADFTAWTLTPRTEFSIAFNEENVLNDKYYTTLYTDFAYTLPTGVKAYKVTEVSEAGVAVKVEMKRIIPAQTPVLLESESKENQTLILSTEDGTAPADNILVGADALINQYQIKTAQVKALFDMAKKILGEDFYNNYIAEYEHLMARNAGTVNNKYFFGIAVEGELDKAYKEKTGDEMENTPVRILSMGNQKLGFYGSWDPVKNNEAFIVTENEELDPVKLIMKGDVYRDGVIDEKDLTALVEIVLGKVTLENKPENYDFDAAHVNEDEYINIADVTALVNILK